MTPTQLKEIIKKQLQVVEIMETTKDQKTLEILADALGSFVYLLLTANKEVKLPTQDVGFLTSKNVLHE